MSDLNTQIIPADDPEILHKSVAEFGLEPTRAEQIERVFIPIHATFRELDAEFKEIALAEEVTPELCEKASVLRKKYVKVRTTAEAAHKEAKASALLEGRAIDGLKNIITYATVQNEDKLREIEEHFENLERERLLEVLEKRTSELREVDADPSIYKLGEMHETVYQDLLASKKKEFEEKKARLKKEEEDRIAKEKADAEERERIGKENEALKKEAAEREAIAAKERAESEAKAAQERKMADERVKVEQEAREKAEAELKAKNDKEAAEAMAKQKAEAKAKRFPDKKKLEAFAGSLIQIKMPEVTSKEANEVLLKAQELLKKTSEYILSQAEKF